MIIKNKSLNIYLFENTDFQKDSNISGVRSVLIVIKSNSFFQSLIRSQTTATKNDFTDFTPR